MKAFGLKFEIKLFILHCLLRQVLCDNNEDRLYAVEETVQELDLLIQAVRSSALVKIEETKELLLKETKELLLKETNAVRKEADEKIKETNENLLKINKTVNAVDNTGILKESCKEFELIGGLKSKKSKATSYLDFGIKNEFYQEVMCFGKCWPFSLAINFLI